MSKQEKSKKTANGINAPAKGKPPRKSFEIGLTTFLVTIAISLCVPLLLTEQISITLFPKECPPAKTIEIVKTVKTDEKVEKPTYYTYGEVEEDFHLMHVHSILEKLGYQNRTNFTDPNWDFLWAYQYPFMEDNPELRELEPHQLVNHFPGIGAITTKVSLATTDKPFIPKAFELPADRDAFLKYANQYPDKLFVQKNNHHREIYVRNISEINYDDGETFIQEYLDDPLLIDGHRFDFGVYVIITSVDPLRLYIYKGDIIFRYCRGIYHPFDPKDLEKYIVGYDFIPTWEMPSLERYFNELGFGDKASFDVYMESIGRSAGHIWPLVEEAIRSIVLEKEQFIADSLGDFSSKRNFYEMMRFDFIIDNDLKPWLLEANMSPILASPEYYENRLFFEQVIFNLFNLVGIGSTINRESLRERDFIEEQMISAEKQIAVNAVQCSTFPCNETCDLECELCLGCLDPEDAHSLHAAYREHMRKGDTKRLFPVPIIDYELDEEYLSYLSPKNQMMSRWFHGKCLMEPSWCL